MGECEECGELVLRVYRFEESNLEVFDGESGRQEVVEHHDCGHAVGYWGLESGFCCEFWVSVHCVVVSNHSREVVDVLHTDAKHPAQLHSLYYNIKTLLIDQTLFEQIIALFVFTFHFLRR